MFWRRIGHFFVRSYRVFINSIYGFIKDDCYTHASVLTFYTLQSIVPVLAFLIGIAKGFGLDEYLEQQLTKTFSEHAEILTYAIKIAHALLEQIQHGVIVGVGIALLIWANLNLLGYVEVFLNDIWKIRESRSYFRRFTDYLGVIILFFLIFIVMSSVTVYITIQLKQLQSYHYLETVSTLLLWGVKLAPVLVSWILFFCLYYLMPNANLKFWPTMIAAIVAGGIFQGWQIIYFNFQSQIFSYNVVYGAFAVLPLFMIWLQFSWAIVLWGAEISANIENDLIFDKHLGGKHLNKITRKQLGLLILYPCLKTFYSGKPPMNDIQIARFLKLPLNTTESMIETLIKGHILTQVNTPDGSVGYHPLYDPSQISIKQVCDIIDNETDLDIVVPETASLTKITEALKKLDNSLDNTFLNISLDELFNTRNDTAYS